MVSLFNLWLPILVSAVLVFVVSSVIHMAFKWHNSDYQGLPNEGEVGEALRKGGVAPGQYVMPYCPDHALMNTPEVQKKFTEGPIALLWIKASGVPEMGKALVGWLLYAVIISFMVAYVTSRTVPTAAHFLMIFRVAGTVAFLAYAGNAAQSSIWMGKPWRATAKEILDGFIYGLVTGGVFGLLWPK